MSFRAPRAIQPANEIPAFLLPKKKVKRDSIVTAIVAVPGGLVPLKDHAKSIDSNDPALLRFRSADWKHLQVELALYAVYKVQRLHWKTSEGLPRGLMPQDLALGAIQKTLEGLMTHEAGKGIRRWNPEREPNLLEFLKSVVDSDVHSLVNLEEHALTNYSPDISSEDAAKLLQSTIDENASSSHSLASAPEAVLNARESTAQMELLYERVMRELRQACRNDPEELKVLAALEELADSEDGFKPSSIARISGLTEEQVRNARRRIERRTRLIREQVLGTKPGLAKSPGSGSESERSIHS